MSRIDTFAILLFSYLGVRPPYTPALDPKRSNNNA
jgi:hypothetical protein